MDIIKKTREDYNKIAKHFSATRNRVWPEFDEFTPLLKNGQRILDWGCGNGRLLMMLEGKNIEYFGMDQSIELLKHARRINKKAIHAGQAHFYCTAQRDKNFSDQFFDVVFMIASFFHLPDPVSRAALLAKTFRELKFGGHVYISVWNLGSDWANKKKSSWKKVGENDFLIPWKDPNGTILAERYYHHFSSEELLSLITAAGFTVERSYYTSTDNRTDDKGGRNLIVIAHK